MLYAAYGSNISVSQMKYRCPDATVFCKGVLRDWKLVFKYHADIVPCEGAEVPVLVWDVTKNDRDNLDFYEGYPHYYKTKMVEVNAEDGKMFAAFVYVMNEENDEPISMPSKYYFDGILEGYVENDMDTGYLYKALDDAGGMENLHD